MDLLLEHKNSLTQALIILLPEPGFVEFRNQGQIMTNVEHTEPENFTYLTTLSVTGFHTFLAGLAFLLVLNMSKVATE